MLKEKKESTRLALREIKKKRDEKDHFLFVFVFLFYYLQG